MAHYATLSFMDYSRELTTTTFPMGEVTAMTLPGLLTAWGILKNTLGGVAIGTQAKETLVMDSTALSSIPPASASAQRELKWLVRYTYGTPAVNASLTIGCADAQASLLKPNTDEALLTAAPWSAFVAAFQSFVKGPGGEDVTITEIRLVGRNI